MGFFSMRPVSPNKAKIGRLLTCNQLQGKMCPFVETRSPRVLFLEGGKSEVAVRKCCSSSIRLVSIIRKVGLGLKGRKSFFARNWASSFVRNRVQCSAFFRKAIGDLKRRQVIGPGSSTIGEAVTSLEATFQKETLVRVLNRILFFLEVN